MSQSEKNLMFFGKCNNFPLRIVEGESSLFVFSIDVAQANFLVGEFVGSLG